MELTIIMALFAVALIWGILIYVTDIRKDQKILNKYLANKHKMKNRLKRSALASKATVSLTEGT
jgi:hypothetical protein